MQMCQHIACQRDRAIRPFNKYRIRKLHDLLVSASRNVQSACGNKSRISLMQSSRARERQRGGRQIREEKERRTIAFLVCVLAR